MENPPICRMDDLGGTPMRKPQSMGQNGVDLVLGQNGVDLAGLLDVGWV